MYGGQLQDLSIQGHEVEGKMNIEYEEVSVSLSDGEQVSLRIPTYSITDWKYGEPHKDLMISPRIAPPMIGLGLLEAIDEKDILSDRYDTPGLRYGDLKKELLLLNCVPY